MRPDGTAAFCCEVIPPLQVGGRPGHITRDGFDAVWNADELVAVRAAMARGERPAPCAACWKREDEGGLSRRLLMNAGYRGFVGDPVEKLPEVGAATGYVLDRPATHFVLEMGNVCTLRCRSCAPICSSRIAADPVHSAWNGASHPSSEEIRVNGRRWHEDVDALATTLARAAEHGDVALTLMGGEPFLIASVWKLLAELVARGVAERIFVGLSSNGQQRHGDVEALVPHFRGFNVSVSLDASGTLYEYMRNGANWETAASTLGWLAGIPNLNLCVVPTLQNLNALALVDLLRFLDERGVRVMYNVLNEPARLSHVCLPAVVRRIAERRLRNYLDHECRPENLAVVRAFCQALEPANDAFDPERFAEFMHFTNDLDASRGECLRDAAPELWSLLRSAGVEWSDDRRHTPAAEAPRTMQRDILERVDRTVAPDDLIFSGFESVAAGAYFTAAAQQLADIDAILREHEHPGLREAAAMADVACHYGRMTRALRAANPSAAVYACDIDEQAVRFCADVLGALPVTLGWDPDRDALPEGLDAIVCFSLLTHTTLEHWRASLRAWRRMLRPGGAATFTYLADRRLGAWLGGEMEHYGAYGDAARREVERCVRESGFGFAALTSGYGGRPSYGITFVSRDVVAREVEAAGLEILALPEESPSFGQELAVVRRPRVPAPAAVPATTRDVRVVAVYDPRCYAPDDETDPGESTWMRLLGSDAPRALPADLGFTDPRVPEVREAQAALAAEHGIDAFAWRYRWSGGPRWDAPLRDLVASGRPAFPFALVLDAGASRVDADEARCILASMLPALADARYVRVDGAALLVVSDPACFTDARASAAAWRAAAREAGIGELHLCALDSSVATEPGELGFDSYAMLPHTRGAPDAAAAMTAPWPSYRAIRLVETASCVGADAGPETFELWLHSAVDATRRRGESVVFVDAWNDWARGAYLEPDDRAGRAMLEAARRAVRGPGGSMALLRRLRDALNADGDVPDTLAELETVLRAHERGRDRVLAVVEAALTRSAPRGERVARRLSVPTRHLPPSSGDALLDYCDGTGGVVLHTGSEIVRLAGEEALIAGWAHCGDCEPERVQLFIAFESAGTQDDAVFHVEKRLPRPDIAANREGYPEHCGFETCVPLRDVADGTYRLAVVQRTPHGTFRDLTPVTVVREKPACSTA